jgi:hypothetical protein
MTSEDEILVERLLDLARRRRAVIVLAGYRIQVLVRRSGYIWRLGCQVCVDEAHATLCGPKRVATGDRLPVSWQPTPRAT